MEKYLIIINCLLLTLMISCNLKSNNDSDVVNKYELDTYSIRLLRGNGNLIYIRITKGSDSLLCVGQKKNDTFNVKFSVPTNKEEFKSIQSLVLKQLDLNNFRSFHVSVYDVGYSASFCATKDGMSITTNYWDKTSFGIISNELEDVINKLRKSHKEIDEYLN